MIYYLISPFFSILLIVLQTTIADIFFSGRLIFEISIIVVIYVGFRLPLIKGALSAFILGFVFDCLVSSVFGFFTLIYVLVFFISFFVSARMVTGSVYFIAIFTLICACLEQFAVVLFYRLIYGSAVLNNIYYINFLQPLIVGLLAPAFFNMMRKVEGFLYDNQSTPVERTGAGRLQTEI